jgi:hypothetical protein
MSSVRIHARNVETHEQTIDGQEPESPKVTKSHKTSKSVEAICGHSTPVLLGLLEPHQRVLVPL